MVHSLITFLFSFVNESYLKTFHVSDSIRMAVKTIDLSAFFIFLRHPVYEIK